MSIRTRSELLLCVVQVLILIAPVTIIGCLQGFGVQRGTTPDGRPSMELCAELAKASPSASSSAVAVASAAPSSSASALPSAPAAGVLQHAK